MKKARRIAANIAKLPELFSSKFLNFSRAIHWVSNFHFGVTWNYYALRICLLYKSRR